MGLWGNLADRVTGAFCKDFLGKILDPSKLVGTVGGVVKPVDNILNQGVGGLTGGQGQGKKPTGLLDQGVGGLLGPSKPKPTPAVRPMWSSPFNNPLGFLLK